VTSTFPLVRSAAGLDISQHPCVLGSVFTPECRNIDVNVLFRDSPATFGSKLPAVFKLALDA